MKEYFEKLDPQQLRQEQAMFAIAEIHFSLQGNITESLLQQPELSDIERRVLECQLRFKQIGVGQFGQLHKKVSGILEARHQASL